MDNQKQYNWMVCVQCMTYNQSIYIEDALNGFTMQETNFPYVCIICDDASTDGEQDVIKNYLEQHFELEDKIATRNEETEDYVLRFARHKTNHNCFFAVFLLKYNHYSIKHPKGGYFFEWLGTKYIALCEGDDFWTDSNKLQNQVDFLEAHLECSICATGAQELYPDGRFEDKVPFEVKEFYTTEDFLTKKRFVATCSIVYRWKYLSNQPRPKFMEICKVGDYPLFLYMCTKGKFGFINKVMSVHRFAAVNSWTRRTNTIKRRWESFYNSFFTFSEFDKYTNRKYHREISKVKFRIFFLCMKSIAGILLKRIVRI